MMRSLVKDSARWLRSSRSCPSNRSHDDVRRFRDIADAVVAVAVVVVTVVVVVVVVVVATLVVAVPVVVEL